MLACFALVLLRYVTILTSFVPLIQDVNRKLTMHIQRLSGDASFNRSSYGAAKDFELAAWKTDILAGHIDSMLEVRKAYATRIVIYGPMDTCSLHAGRICANGGLQPQHIKSIKILIEHQGDSFPTVHAFLSGC